MKKNEWRAAAKKELDDWYKNRAEQLAKAHANHKFDCLMFDYLFFFLCLFNNLKKS